MKIRLYVAEKSGKQCDKKAIDLVTAHVAKKGYCYGHFMDCVRIEGIMFGHDERGIFTEVATFVGGLPENIQCYTFRLVTIYDKDKAEMYNAPVSGFSNENEIESIVDTFYDSSLPSKRQDEFWRIRISAPTWECAVNRYKDIRAGKSVGDIWTGEFAQNVTTLASAIPELIASLATLSGMNANISKVLAKVEKKDSEDNQ